LKANVYKKLPAVVPLSHKDGKLKSAKLGLVVLFWYVHSAEIVHYTDNLSGKVTSGDKK